MRTQIKICGITRQVDMETASQLGVDVIGLVFYPPSKRYVTPVNAARLLARKPPGLLAVAVFMNACCDEVTRIVRHLPFDCLQFHGVETEQFCASFALPYWKSVPMGSVTDFASYTAAYLPSASGFVLDSNREEQPGGSGKTFELPKYSLNRQVPLIVSGGLTEHNVARGIRCLRPYAVDVSSGVEIEKGIKSACMMKRFVAAVRKTDAEMEKWHIT